VTGPAQPVPTVLRVAIWLMFLEALGVAVAAGYFAYESATQPAVSFGTAATVALWPAGTAAVLAVLGWLLARRRAWARGPAVVLELLFLPIGYYMVGGGLAWLGVPVMILGLVCAGLLLAPSSRAALGIH
jgi:hypothetical protein